MKGIRAAAVLSVFFVGAAALLAPGFSGYAARIDLNRCERAVVAATSLEAGLQRRLLAAVRDELHIVAERLPDDVRPTYLLGTSALLLGESGEATVDLRRSLTIEERPETDFNLSRAHEAAGDAQASADDALRAIWLSPALLRQLPKPAREPVASQIRELERELKVGSASAIPKLSASDAAVRQHDR